jgi:hypothetical protein
MVYTSRQNASTTGPLAEIPPDPQLSVEERPFQGRERIVYKFGL